MKKRGKNFVCLRITEGGLKPRMKKEEAPGIHHGTSKKFTERRAGYSFEFAGQQEGRSSLR